MHHLKSKYSVRIHSEGELWRVRILLVSVSREVAHDNVTVLASKLRLCCHQDDLEHYY